MIEYVLGACAYVCPFSFALQSGWIVGPESSEHHICSPTVYVRIADLAKDHHSTSLCIMSNRLSARLYRAMQSSTSRMSKPSTILRYEAMSSL